ncbi:serine/arginine-rich splicing factor RS31 isoform X2 [Pyrus x bretschneideri]|nr:serine/arginine-rich splicing factor RS31 isoform X2 [Pyrus x bretschneideri]
MNRMLKKLSFTSIIGHLDMTGAGYLWNGLRVNVVAIMMGLNHWQTRARLKVCLLSSVIPSYTKVRDIERHFEPYGKVLHVRIRWNFAFVQFDTQEEATEALQATNLSKILDRVVGVEYALRDDSERDDVERGDRYCDSPPRGGSYGIHGDSPYWKSPSHGYRRRPSPDYGHPRSPVYDRYNGPVYDRRRSPEHGRNASTEYGRYCSCSPIQR